MLAAAPGGDFQGGRYFLPKINLPGHHSTHGPLGTNEATYSDEDTCSRHKVKLY